MSASTIAIAASPAVNNTSLAFDSNSKSNTRRRQVLVTEKKSTVEMVADGGNPGVSSDKVVINGKDLSHTIRGETVLERPRDLSHLKEGRIAASTISPRRKKSTSKPEKPRWQTVLSILTKNCLLFAILLGLGQMIWKWADRLGESTHTPFAVLDIEGRISEVESSLKKTAKMMQVQLEVVDKKIGSETGIVTRELMKLIEEKGAFFEKELKKLEARTDNLDKSLGELGEAGFFTKEEFDKFLNDFTKSRNIEGSDKDLSLDDIRNYAREIVKKEIEKHAADGLGRVDYAVASAGARVVRHSEPYNLGKASGWFPAAKIRNGVHGNAHKMLEPSFGEPGQCFPLQGNSGFVEIKLRTGIIPDAVTLEHVAKSVAYDRSSAPRDCRISVWFEGQDDDPSAAARARMFTLLEFAYDLDKSNAQTFNVETADAGVVNMVRLDFTSNHGSPSHTCIYRLRVHGYEPDAIVAMAMQQQP